MILPDLTVSMTGEVKSNLAEFRSAITSRIAEINMEPSTDVEFGQAVEDVKMLSTAEATIKDVKDKALAQAEEIYATLTGLDKCAEDLRQPRLHLEKVIKARKDEIKQDIIQEGIDSLDCAKRHRDAAFGNSIREAIKGKKTTDSMKKAVEVMVVTHNARINKSRNVIAEFIKEHGESLVMDAEDMEIRAIEYVEGELRRRLEQHKMIQEKKELESKAKASQEEAAKAKQAEKNDFDLPDPSKGNKATPAAPDADSELQWITDQVVFAFSPLREIREKIQDRQNLERFDGLRDAINKAWKEFTS